MTTESNNENQIPETVSEGATEETSQSNTEGSNDVGTKTPDTKSDTKPDYSYVPQKFLKPDGTPDFEKLSKSYTGLEKKLGTKPFVPAASVDEYEWDQGELQLDGEKLTEFKAQVLEKGFTPEQFKFVMESHKNVIEAMTWTADKVESELKQSWGKQYDEMANAARVGFDQFAASDSNPNDPVWNHPSVMKLLARIGSELGEDSLAGKGAGPRVGTQLDRSEIDRLMQAPDYWDNKESQAKVTAWYKQNVR